MADGGATLIYTLSGFRFKLGQRLISSTGLELPGFALAGAIGHEDLANFGFLIAGHTDASGDASHNQKLSESRANAVKTYLIRRHHVARERLETTGWGEQRLKVPMQPNHPINRRVEVTAIPFSDLQ